MDFVKVVQLGFVFSLLMVHNAIGAPESDLIEMLPGQNEKVPFKQYGGYITTNEEHGRALYYYFVEAQTNATSKPLALWLNGGKYTIPSSKIHFCYFNKFYYYDL
jgi:serine carboxypeptidase-like clade 2